MVTWHLTMKRFPAKCYERATLRKLWRQTGNSSLLPLKCWPLLHMIRGGLMLLLESWHIFQIALLGTVNFVSLGFQCFPWLCLGKQNIIYCSPWDQSLSVKYFYPMGTPLKRTKVLIRNVGKNPLEEQRSCFVSVAWNVFHPKEVPILKQHMISHHTILAWYTERYICVPQKLMLWTS